MSSIQTELSSLIKTFAENSIKHPQADDPFQSVDAPPVPVVEKVEVPATEPVTPPVATPVVEKPTEETSFDNWDDSEPQTTQTPATPEPVVASVDLTPLAKVLGKEELKQVEDAVKEIEEIKKKAEIVGTLPEDLGKAIEIARLGGNYLEYLGVSQIDWGKEDPVVLYENYVEDQFFDPKTNLVDYEKADKLLDSISDDEKEFRGKELQKAYIAHQKSQKDLILNQAKNAKAQFESTVRETVNSLTDINGYKLNPAKKAELLEFVLSGNDLKESDVKTRVVNAFVKKYFTQLDKYMKTQVKNATQRKMLEEAQLPSVKPSTETVEVSPKKGYGLNEYLEDLKKQKGFTN